MYCSRKNPYPHRRDWYFLGGGSGGFCRPRNLGISKGGGWFLKKSLPWGKNGYFLELHNVE